MRRVWFLTGLAFCLALSLPAFGQLTDNTQATQTENAGINKSLADQIGAGQGDVNTPGSSIFIIERDPFRSVRRGRQLFQRKFTVGQGFGPLTGDGFGDLEADGSIGAGLVDSCAGCHGRPRGSAGSGGNVATRPDSRDAPHLFGLGLQEMLADEITADLRAARDAGISQAQLNGVAVNVALTSKGISYGSLVANPDGTVDTSGVDGVNTDLRVRPFFAQGATISMREFIVGALNAEMGLETFDPMLATAAAGGVVVTPSGMVLDGTTDQIEGPPVSSAFEDGDGDGLVDEIDPALVDHLEFYLLNYFKPGRLDDNDDDSDSDYDSDGDSDGDGLTARGRARMADMGCTSCHIPDLVIDNDRRVADVETVFDPVNGIFNQLFATASARFTTVDDGSGHPSIKVPSGDSFVVENFFADLKRHDLGPNFWERNFDGTLQKEFLTEPLWGVASTGPYGHDGRSINLKQVILRHGGEAQAARDAFVNASKSKQQEVLDFLGTLVLFPPDDTASNLNPGNPADPDFPQRGHGNIALGALFNDPLDPE